MAEKELNKEESLALIRAMMKVAEENPGFSEAEILAIVSPDTELKVQIV